ncbi:hypothetical protein ACFQH6_07045 [Halobacteriaceae archaeon GCM10025711]
MALIDSVVVFVVSLLIGALGIYVGASVVVDVRDYSYAVLVALVGAVEWGVVGFFLGWIPFLGPLVTLLAYVGVINALYPGGFVDAVLVALVAWVATFVVVFVLALLGLSAFEAVGVPGV